MDYKGYNIAVHELGHNVEQVFSLYEVDHTLLAGVPNNAFTEALAFVFQARDLELLGLAKPSAREPSGSRVLNDFWATLGDRRRGAGRHRRLALDVRAPGRDARPAARGDAWRSRAGPVEPVLRAGAGREGHGAARHLLAHDRAAASTCPPTRWGTSSPSSSRSSSRARGRRGVRADGHVRPGDAGSCGWSTPRATRSAAEPLLRATEAALQSESAAR